MRFIPISEFEKDELRFIPISEFEAPDTGDETARLAARYKAPEAPPPEPQGLISRAIDTVKGTVSSIPAAIAEKFTPYKSVLEAPPSAEAQQADIDKRLGYGAGPISQATVAKADAMLMGRAPAEAGPALTVARARAERGEETFDQLAQRVNRDALIQKEAEAASRRKFAEENPLLGSVAAGAAGMVSGTLNIPSVAADAFNQTFVNPLLQAAGLKPLDRVPTAVGTEYLAKTASEFMPEIGKRSMAGAWKNDEFSPWLMSKLAANSPQIASQLVAAFAPPLRAVLLPGMGGTAAGQSYAQGDDSRVAVAKGLLEYGTEMLPLQAFDKIGDALKGLSPAKTNAVLAVAGQRALQAGGAITANGLTNAIEETAAQFGGNVLDKYFQGKDIELSKGLAEAAVVGAAVGKVMSVPQVADVLTGAYEPNAQIARAIEENTAAAQWVAPSSEIALDRLSPYSAGPNVLQAGEVPIPQAPTSLQLGQAFLAPADTTAINQAGSVDEAITAAQTAAGEVGQVGPAPVLPTPGLAELPPIGTAGLPGLPAMLGLPSLPTPAAPAVDELGRIEPTLEPLAGLPVAGDLGRVEPTLGQVPQTPLPSAPELGEVNPTIEQQFGLDKLRMKAPRPQRIQGVPVAQLTDDELTTIAADDAVPAITRRSAAVELQARGAEATAAAAPTLPAAPAAEVAAQAPTAQTPSATPRPQNIQGVPTVQLTDTQLTTIAADEAAPAIARRNASLELQARGAETTLAAPAAPTITADAELPGQPSPAMGQPVAQGGTVPALGGVAPGTPQLAQQQPAPGLQQPGTLNTTEGAQAAGLPQPLKLAKTATARNMGKTLKQFEAETGIAAEPYTEPLTEAQQAASALGRVMGNTVTFLKSAPGQLPNGFVVPSTNPKDVYLAFDTDAPVLGVAVHEITHLLPEPIKAKLDAGLRALFNDKYLPEFAAKRNLDVNNTALLDNEIPAYIAQAISERPDFWQDLRAKMGDGDFAEVARVILDKLSTFLAGTKREYGQDFLDRYVTDVAKARDLLSTAYADAMKAQGKPVVAPAAKGGIQASERINGPLDRAVKAEGKRATAVVSAKPGREFTVGDTTVNVVKYPKAKDLEFVTSRLHARVREVLTGSDAVNFLAGQFGLKDASLKKVGEIRGLWAGEREDTFLIRASNLDGSPASFEDTRKLANLLGFAFIQEGAVTVEPSHGNNGGIPSMLIGKPGGGKLTRSEIDSALSAANSAGFFGASEAMSGEGIKFLFFADDSSTKSTEEQYKDFVDQVGGVQQSTGLTASLGYNTNSELDGANDYWTNATGQPLSANLGGAGDQNGPGGSSDLFRGTVDSLLAPYVSALSTEGFDFDFNQWQRAFGATDAQRDYLKLKVAALDEINKHGVVPKLRQRVPITNLKQVGSKALITQKTTEANAAEQLGALDTVLAKSSNPVKSTESWLRMEAMAYGTNDVPMAPNRFIQMYNSDGIYQQLKSLSPGQVSDAQAGAKMGQEFRRLYESGKVDPAITAKLMLWSFLSRGVSPYVQESAFVDLVDKIDPFIPRVLDGTFSDDDAKAWNKIVSATIKKGTGQPGAGTTHNANAFGSSFMRGMAAPAANGQTKMQYLHGLFSDPSKTGPEIRREFVKMGEGVGIDNKVISFTLLVIGHDDVAVLDRVQIANTFDDGRLGDYNLYDGIARYGYEADGKMVWVGSTPADYASAKEAAPDGEVISAKVPGSGMANLTTGARGLMIYEPLENALEKVLPGIFGRLRSDGLRSADTRPSVGRWHWESWVAYSGQEASHKTLEALLAEAKGQKSPYADVAAKEGEYGAFSYGTEYARDAQGKAYKLYHDSTGQAYRFSLDSYKDLMVELKKKGKDGVVPSGFKVSENADGSQRTEPWFKDPRVNLAKFDEAIQRIGQAETTAQANKGTIQASERTVDSEAVFEGLDGRGLAKARAETALNARPDADQVRFIQDNFLDILVELEDSGRIKINCK